MEEITEIKLDTLPSANFGPGVELLMNGKKKEGPAEINTVELDKLEKELNELSGVEKPKVGWGGAINIAPEPPVEIKPIATERTTTLKFDEVRQLPEAKPKVESWDGFKSVNTGVVMNDPKPAEAEMPVIEMTKQKFKYLRKLEELENRGVKLTKKYSMESPLQEMQGEYDNIVEEKEKSNSVKFQGKMLMACITGLEFLNTKFDPFDVKLDGWAEQVGENIDDYDDIFMELHEKYKSKAKMAPELKLMFQLGGSAMMLHMTNSMFKSAVPGMDDIMRQNPELMQKFTQAAVSSMAATKPGLSSFMNTVQQPRSEPRSEPRNEPRSEPPRNYEPRPEPRPRAEPKTVPMRPEMKGPSDLDQILTGLKVKPPPVAEPEITLHEDPGSTVSITELHEMKESLKAPKSKRRVKSDKNTISLF